MNQSAKSTHVHRLIPDYVLGLLSGDEADWVTAHTSRCDDCRRVLAQEQAIGRSARAALQKATKPDRNRLRRLMPVPPAVAGSRSTWLLRSPGLAAAGVMLLLLFSAIALYAGQRPGVWGVTAPTVRSTATTLTETPTLTATREMTATVEGQQASTSPVPIRQSAAVNQTGAPAPALVPVPPSTWLR
jgi:anti-sigma factor RsiW